MIDDFRAAYDWLSNFYRSEITYDGVTAPTVEHAFQAAKAVGASDRAQILVSPSPGHAKRLGRKLQRIRPDWEDVKRQIMLDGWCSHTIIGYLTTVKVAKPVISRSKVVYHSLVSTNSPIC